jgi:hypothetical protein
MKRREFITLLGGAAASPILRPLPLRAQQGDRMRRIGVLMAMPRATDPIQLEDALSSKKLFHHQGPFRALGQERIRSLHPKEPFAVFRRPCLLGQLRKLLRASPAIVCFVHGTPPSR